MVDTQDDEGDPEYAFAVGNNKQEKIEVTIGVCKLSMVIEAREPQNASETRSMLGLVNYCGGFIPDLATISEPLRRLTKAGVPFVFGKEKKEAFEELKKRLASAETLGYFDKDAPTQIVADASPVGLGLF